VAEGKLNRRLNFVNAFLILLHRSPHGLCRGGAARKNPSRHAPFGSSEKIAPANSVLNFLQYLDRSNESR